MMTILPTTIGMESITNIPPSVTVTASPQFPYWMASPRHDSILTISFRTGPILRSEKQTTPEKTTEVSIDGLYIGLTQADPGLRRSQGRKLVRKKETRGPSGPTYHVQGRVAMVIRSLIPCGNLEATWSIEMHSSIDRIGPRALEEGMMQVDKVQILSRNGFR
ncbi:hypothetical protein P168DRAFT_64620 [Aspergillus campestris IBT 28561]|uniref:Uncharacterized protein n=1 Tax=Aspergillus campestris (strain IBT 28561) TaxID=1392248 RepID=A0A2I1CT36_ASPC2|nr:uncharacterized protein P168DRAFT_64620 [Aspergillus campestris IBT 28561]PKY00796.1 hypothetical protein P168DRAFT_64620 [Aspergillus campestris IBT 28561]